MGKVLFTANPQYVRGGGVFACPVEFDGVLPVLFVSQMDFFMGGKFLQKPCRDWRGRKQHGLFFGR